MLINCPKCGFSQPKDRYCASCGVDMDHFRPQPTPWLGKFWNNPTTPVGLTMIVAIMSIWYIRQQWKLASPPRDGNQKTFVRSSEVAGSGSKRNGAGEVAQLPESATDSEALPPPPPPPSQRGLAAMAGGTKAGETSGAESGNIQDESSRAGQFQGSIPLRISFIEVPKALLDFLLEEQRKAGDTGVSRVHVQRLWSYVASNPESELYSLIQPFGGSQMSMKKNLGDGSDSEGGLNLDTQISLRSPASASGAIAGTLQLNANIKLEEAGNLHTKEKALNTMFSLKPGNYWIQKLELPRGEPADSRGLSGVQRVFQSQSFQNRESEVTLIIEVDRSAE